MSVELTSEYEERKRLSIPTWELLKTTSLVHALHKAKDLGWKDKDVQVRVESGIETTYYVEPFEKDCGCPNILKYADFFD